MQKYSWTFLCLICLSSVCYAIDGNELYDICGVALESPDYENAYGTGYCYGYIIGVINQGDRQICPPEKITNKQTVQIVYAYLKSHLEQLDQPANVLVDQALGNAWPCNR